MSTPAFDNLPARVLDNGFIYIEALANAGPRITHLSVPGGENPLVRLGAKDKRATEYGDLYFIGGHRLWHAPEALPRTYIPDNDGLTVTDLPDGLCLQGPTEPGTGIAKTIELRLASGRASATFMHTLRNDGLWEVELAPWALSMLRQQGTLILPQPRENSDAQGLLHNRSLAIWPYTRLNDPRLVLRDDFILVRAAPALPPLKIGYNNPHGWLAYWLDGLLFHKSFDLHPGQPHPDAGCNTETYCNDQFIEMETLGPLTRLAPGASVTLTETWQLFPSLDQPFLTDEIRAVLREH
jgi:hypothetical protein